MILSQQIVNNSTMCQKCMQGGPALLPEVEKLFEVPKGGGPAAAPPAPKFFKRFNTDLDAPYVGGNFNFLYNPGSDYAHVILNTYIDWKGKFSQTDKNDFIARLQDAVSIWDGAGQVQIRDSAGNYTKHVTLRFYLGIQHTDEGVNKVTHVSAAGTRAAWYTPYKDRDLVTWSINVFINSSRNTLVHELGHAWGLRDEYDAGWFENHFSPGHVDSDSDAIKDKVSLMNDGYMDEVNNIGEFRTRFFVHFGRAIAGTFLDNAQFLKLNMMGSKVVSKSVLARIALLKKNIAGQAPYRSDQLYNPVFTSFQVTKR